MKFLLGHLNQVTQREVTFGNRQKVREKVRNQGEPSLASAFM
jgi:hypothetical protein